MTFRFLFLNNMHSLIRIFCWCLCCCRRCRRHHGHGQCRCRLRSSRINSKIKIVYISCVYGMDCCGIVWKLITRRNRHHLFMDTFVRPALCPIPRTPVTKSTFVETFRCWPKWSHQSRRQNVVQPYHWPQSFSIVCSMVLDAVDRDSSVLGIPTKTR